MSKKGLLIDVYYCTGCHSCEVACEQENHLPADQFGIKITEMVLKERDRINIDYVPYVTNLCTLCAKRVHDGGKPSCVKHCLARCISYGTAEELMAEAESCRKPMIFLK